MSEEKKSTWLNRILSFTFRNPISLICLVALAYCAVQVYILHNSPFIYKAAMMGIAGFWLFVFIAKNMFKFFLFLMVIAGLAYGWFYFTGRDQKICEENGGFWNKNTMTCEEKVSFWKQTQKFFNLDTK